jgi:hypothetical protein
MLQEHKNENVLHPSKEDTSHLSTGREAGKKFKTERT